MFVATLVCLLVALAANVVTVLLWRGGDADLAGGAVALAASSTAIAGVLLGIRSRTVARVKRNSPLSADAHVHEDRAAGAIARVAPPRDTFDDDPIDHDSWLKLVEENVSLVDELDRHRRGFDPPRQEVADHVICRLQEILERCGVDSIDCQGAFNRAYHQAELLPDATGGVVVRMLSPGFRVGKRVLRKARVQVHKSAGS